MQAVLSMKKLRKNKRLLLTIFSHCDILHNVPTMSWLHGGIAQLGERLNGIQEVSGSIPLISTIEALKTIGFQGFFVLFGTF